VSQPWIASIVLLWIVVLFALFLLAGALRQIGVINLRLGNDPGALITDTGLDRGTRAPDFEAIDGETGEPRRLSELPARPRLLVFLSPSCYTCQELVPHLNEVAKTRRRDFDFVVVCTGEVGACRQVFKGAARVEPAMLIDTTGAAESRYEVAVMPFAYLIDHERNVVIRGVANDWRHLESLLEQEGTLEAGRSWTEVSGSGGSVLTQVDAKGGDVLRKP